MAKIYSNPLLNRVLNSSRDLDDYKTNSSKKTAPQPSSKTDAVALQKLREKVSIQTGTKLNTNSFPIINRGATGGVTNRSLTNQTTTKPQSSNKSDAGALQKLREKVAKQKASIQPSDEDVKKSANLEALQKEIEALENIEATANKYENDIRIYTNRANTSKHRGNGLTASSTYDKKIKDVEAEYKKFLLDNGFEDFNDIKNQIAEKKQYKNSAKYIQDRVALENNIRAEADFSKYVAKGEALGNEKRDGWLVPDKNRKNQVAYFRNNPEAMKSYEKVLDSIGGTAERVVKESAVEYKLAKYGTKEQIETYYAYLGKGDEENANKYLEYITEKLNIAASKDIAKEQDITFKKLKFGATAGFDQFEQGFINLFNTSDEYIPHSAVQLASGQVRESLKNSGPEILGSSLGQMGYDFINTTTNMLPSIGASYLSNAIVPGSGAFVGASLMGGSAAGNSYQEKLNAGWDKKQARTYSTIVGVSEAGLQYALGGIGSLGGKLTGKSAQAIARGIDNAALRFAATYGMKMTSEGLEEALQEVLNPFFENLALGYQKNDLSDVDWEQVAYSGMLGALSAGFLEGGSTSIEVFSENSSAKEIGPKLRKNGYTSRILEIASLSTEGSETHELYSQYMKKGINAENISDLQLGRLFVNAEAGAKGTLSNELKSMRHNNSTPVEARKNDKAPTQTTPTTLEQAAREVVEKRNKKSGKITAETLEALTADNETIYVDEVKQVTGFGDEGAKVVTGLANRNGVTFSQALKTVETAYKAGLTGIKEAQVSFVNKLQETAFRAGKYDRAMQDADKLAQSKNATVYEGAFHENEYTKDYTDDEKKLIASTAKILKMDINAVDEILANVTYDVDGNEVKHYANAKHDDGYMEISNQRAVGKAIYQMVMHEAFGHRVNQLAPTEFGVVMDALYQRAKAKGRYYDFDYVRGQHNNAGLNKNARDNIEEVAVRELETIFGSAKEVNKWLSEISCNQELKNNWQKFCDWITELIEKIKTAWSQRKMTAEEKAKANETIAELDRIKGLLANAVKAAENTATEIMEAKGKSSESLENQGNKEYNGNVNYSLKKGEQYGVMWTLEKNVLDNNEVSAFYEKISETNNNKYHNYHKASDGQLIYEIGNKLIYTDGDYNYPHISQVVTFNTNDKNIIEYGKECVYDGEKYGFSLEDSLEIGSIVYGKEIATISSFGDSEADGRQNGSGKGTNSTATNRKSQKNVNGSFSLKDSEGNTLTQEQQEYFKDSKVRDENGDIIPLSERFNKQSDDINYSFIDDIKAKYNDKTDHLYIYEKKNTISIDNMVVKKEYRNQGVGTDILNDVIEYADGVQKTITLTPTSEFGTKERLKKWYKTNGFVENKGRNTDFTIRDTMYRLPNNTSFSLIDTDAPTSKDTKALLETIEKLKNEFELTKFAKADQKKLAKMTKSLLKEYSSQSDYDETFKAIDELYQYLANGEDGHPAVWADAYSRAYGIAERIVDNALVVDDEQYREYKGLRDYLRNTPMKLDTRYDSVPSGYENFQDFRRKNWGRLNFTKDGLGVDSVYQELTELYPELFSDKKSTIEDMLEQIVEVLDSIQPTEVNPFSYEMKAASSYLANDIMDRFFDIPQAKPTFADKAERRVVEARIKGGKKVEAVREQTKKRVAAEREKAKRQLAKLRQQRDAKVKKEQQKRREAISKMSESQKAKVLRAQITRHVGELDKRLRKGTDKKHIPQELENAVLALLYNINLESNYTYDPETRSYKKNDKGLPTNKTKAFEKLRDVYLQIAQNNDYGLVLDNSIDGLDPGSKNIFTEVMKLSDKKVADMSSEELQKIYDAIRIVEHTISTAGKMFAIGKWERITNAMNDFANSVSTRREKHPLLEKQMSLDVETPATFFSHFGDAGNTLFEALLDAQDNERIMKDEFAELSSQVASAEYVKNAGKELYEFETFTGKKLTLSKAHIINLYLLSKRPQGLQHILGDGIHQPKAGKAKRDSKSTKISQSDLNNMFSKLSEEDKNICVKLQNTTKMLAEWGNEASMKVFGYEKFKDPDYWTIKSANEGVKQSVADDGNMPRTLKNMGSAKPLEDQAKNAVDVDDAFSLLEKHASQMIRYAAWLEISEDVNRIFNYEFKDEFGSNTGVSFKSILEDYAGSGGMKYFLNLMRDIQNGIKSAPDTNIEKIVTGIYNNATKSAVAHNIRVVVQQPTSLPRAAMVLGDTAIMAATAKGVTIKSIYDGWQEALRYSPIASQKANGGYDINTSDKNASKWLFKPETKKGKFKNAVEESGFWAASKADEMTWGIIWNACKIKVNKSNNLERGSTEYYNQVAKLFRKVIVETQVVDGVLLRSQAMRSSSGWIRSGTTFTGEPTQSLNIVLREYDKMRYEKGAARGKAIKRLGNSIRVYVLSNVLAAFVASLWDGVRDDDEDEYWKKVWKNFSGINGDEETWKDYAKNILLQSNVVNNLNPMTWLPIIRDFMSYKQGYGVERIDAASIGAVVKAGDQLEKSISGEGKRTIGYATLNFLTQSAKLIGKSPYNLFREIEAIIRTTQVESGNLKARYETEKLKTNPKNDLSTYVDILYKAYSTDNDAYDYIYNDLIKSGVDAEKIKSGMETRMKKAEGVEKVTELKKRYMTPETEKKYDSNLKRVKSSQTWKSASSTERKDAEADLYSFLTGTGEDIEATRAEARALGIDETEYTLWQLAKSMANSDGKDGLSAKEKALAIQNLDLDSDTEWDLYLFKVDEDKAKGARYARDRGVSADTYSEFVEMLYEIDKPTKNGTYGTFTQDEATKAVKRLSGLSRNEKAVLWQSVNTKWKKNPF